MNDLEKRISYDSVSLYIIMKYFFTKNKDYFKENNIKFFNYKFIVNFNEKNSTGYSINHFLECMDKLTKNGVCKKFYKITCTECSSINVIKHDLEGEKYQSVFETGVCCTFCLTTFTTNNNINNIREASYYCLNEEIISKEMFEEKPPTEEEPLTWTQQKINILKTNKSVTISTLIILTLLMFVLEKIL